MTTSSASLFTLGTVLLAFGAAACSSSNDPSTSDSNLNGAGGGASPAAGGAPSTTGGASNSPGGTPAGTGGNATSMAGSSSGNGGSSMTSSGGASTSTGGSSTGGSGTSSGGASSGGSSTSTGGSSTSTGGSSGGEFSPPCGKTAAGVDIAKGGACTPQDPQLCYKQCGPVNIGFKAETCMASGYDEGDCQFPSSGNYSCFKIPSADSSMCPADPPKHNDPCTLPACTVPCTGTACEMCGLKAGYLDSKGNPKTGYCVCIGGTNGNKWSCSSATAWPCPGGQGC